MKTTIFSFVIAILMMASTVSVSANTIDPVKGKIESTMKCKNEKGWKPAKREAKVKATTKHSKKSFHQKKYHFRKAH